MPQIMETNRRADCNSGCAQRVGRQVGELVVFTGTPDASAALGVTGDLFVVANDEDSLLRFYRFSQPGPPLQTFST